MNPPRKPEDGKTGEGSPPDADSNDPPAAQAENSRPDKSKRVPGKRDGRANDDGEDLFDNVPI